MITPLAKYRRWPFFNLSRLIKPRCRYSGWFSGSAYQYRVNITCTSYISRSLPISVSQRIGTSIALGKIPRRNDNPWNIIPGLLNFQVFGKRRGVVAVNENKTMKTRIWRTRREDIIAWLVFGVVPIVCLTRVTIHVIIRGLVPDGGPGFRCVSL